MLTHSVRLIQEIPELEKDNCSEKPFFIEKEIDMGFFDHHFFQLKDGVLVNECCQRVNYCSCDCNFCAWLL